MTASLKSSVGLGQNIQIVPSFSAKDGLGDIQMLIATTLHIFRKYTKMNSDYYITIQTDKSLTKQEDPPMSSNELSIFFPYYFSAN